MALDSLERRVDRSDVFMLTHADVRHLILTQKWIQDGHAFTVEYVQKKINEVALQKGLMKPKQQYETTSEVDRLFPGVIWELLLREIFVDLRPRMDTPP